MPQPKALHPCQTCGACCASFRVAFHWREAEANPDDQNDHSVPLEYTEDLDLNQRCMKGTNSKHQPKCVALMGHIGESAHCVIYANRSSACRNFKASYEDGYQNIRCDEARARHGLRPLTKRDYPKREDLDFES
jgi:Fe-S-cluster containining protein